MKLIHCQHGPAALRGTEAVLFSEVNATRGTTLPGDLLVLIQNGDLAPLRDLRGIAGIPLTEVTPALPYTAPPKILCVGPNYRCQLPDPNTAEPDEPGSFLKPASCMVAPGGDIVLPPPDVCAKADAECELGIIIGRRCRFVPEEHVSEVIFGYTATLDLTGLDIIAKSPRFLTRAKSIDTFFSFGPVIVTPDEIADIGALEVVTELNGAPYSRDLVSSMCRLPAQLVRFHSDFYALDPGDIISTGCPKAAPFQPGDTVGGRIDGVCRITAHVTQGSRVPLY